MKPLFVSILILGGLVGNVLAYPISPRPLRKLIMESEFIIIGHVDAIKSVKVKKDDFFGGSIAEVKVTEVLKGIVKERIISIPFNSNMICPAPPHFQENTDVIVFLDKDDNKNYHIHALSYGLKTRSLNEIEVYKSRINEMQQILLITDKDQQFVESTEWLVKCCENPATRYEGVYELSPESDFMSYYDRTESQPFQYELSVDQKMRLKAALLSTTEISYHDFGLVDLVYPENKEEVFNYLLNTLQHLKQDDLWLADECMKRLCYVKTSDRLEKLVADFDHKKYGEDKDRKELPSILTNFIQEIQKM
ncbi:MAG TPA: hypothetical protein VL443_02195 [Cyclobacteriaceae bacterium]|jgi:hypothetical protein|nr:hypothetical protein [Cyclobacteriaceae bacterium]